MSPDLRDRWPGLTRSHDGFGEANASLWADTLRDARPIPAPDGAINDCDVAIIGGGLTGLWTAYYLKRLQPDARIVIFEAKHIAFGASGRAGGWAIASLDQQQSWLAGLPEARQAEAVDVVTGTLDEIERVVMAHGIACGYHRGGMVRIAARHPSQMVVLNKYCAQIEAENGGRPIAPRLDGAAAHAISPMTGAMGAVAFPHCAVVNPARLAHGLAHVLVAMGVSIRERCRVLSIADRCINTDHGPVTANVIVPAIEGYAGTLPTIRGRILPVYSHVIATEPLSPDLRASIGLSDRQAFADCSHISTYGQITEDNRVVFGALASYPYAERIGALSDGHVRRQYAQVHAVLTALWPQLSATRITHAWSGVLGVPRSFRPCVIEDPTRSLIWGGGYVARGISNSNLFGRTIAELIDGADTARTRAPWVRRDTDLVTALRAWEPEPLKWLGIAAATWPGKLAEGAVRSRHLPEAARGSVIRLSQALGRGR